MSRDSEDSEYFELCTYFRFPGVSENSGILIEYPESSGHFEHSESSEEFGDSGEALSSCDFSDSTDFGVPGDCGNS